MEDFFAGLGNFIDTMIDKMPPIAHSPLAWCMGLLVIIVFFVLYDQPQDKQNVRRSITGLLRYALRVVLAFIEDLLAAIENITGFVDVVRVILKGKLTDGVQFLLGNYAIIALSVASFFTTYNGLKEVVGPYTAAPITFGIQVGILAMSSKLALDINKNNQERVRAFKEIDYFNKGTGVKVTEGKESATAFNSTSVYSWQVGPKSDQTGIPKEGQGRKIFLHSLLLVFSMIVSIYFSYVYFYERHVRPSQEIDINIRTKNTISEITEEYSSKISEMHSILLRSLQDINRLTRGIVDIAINTQIDERIEALGEQLSQQRQEREELINRRAGLIEQYEAANAEGNTAGAEGIGSILETIEEDIDEVEHEIRSLETELQSSTLNRDGNIEYFSRREVLTAIDELEGFYTDPLSYIGTLSSTENWRSVVGARFEQILSYYQDNINDMDSAGKDISEDWLTIFNNYADLCEYYNRHGEIGFYNILESAEVELPGDNRLNQESAVLLELMLNELSSVPDMVQWSDMRPIEQKALQALSKTKDMKDLYRLYRVSTGKVDILEMVFLKWIIDFNGLLIVIFFLAVFLDGLAVILTLVKGTMHYENKLPRYRKLLHRMFIQDPGSDKDKWSIRIVQWAGGLGVAIGLLTFGFYYRMSGSEKETIHQLVSLICFVALGALISRIIVCLYMKAHNDAKDWKDEEIYGELRTAWKTQGIESMDDLQTRMKQAYDDKADIPIKQNEVEWLVRLFSSEESEDIVKVLRPNARLLFRHIGMMRLKKRTWEYYFANQGLSSAKDYIQGWYDEIDVAYISYEAVKEHGMAFLFAVLRAEGLVVYNESEKVSEPIQTTESDAPQRSETEVYYILSGRFLRILFELIMEAYRGTGFEDDFYIADDLADAYEAEEMTED